MRWVIRLFVAVIAMIPIGFVVLALMCVESSPTIDGDPHLSGANVERARQLLHEHDPRKLRSGEKKTVTMNAEELNLVLYHIANRLGPSGTRLALEDETLAFAASVDVARFLPSHYLNLSMNVGERDGEIRFEQLKIGRIAFPDALVDVVFRFVLEHVYRASGVHNAAEVIQSINIAPNRLEVTYEWKAGIVEAVRDRLIAHEDREKLRVYNEIVAREIAAQAGSAHYVKLLETVFRHARERSHAGGAVEENRAAIIVLAATINGTSFRAIGGDAETWEAPQRVRFTLHKRRDFVRHFTTSAALASTGGKELSNAIGLYKEIDDADGGSGFSFKDLAADMAGTRFGRTAVADEASARKLQDAVHEGLDEYELIPNVNDLVENLSDAQFEQRFGGIDGARYRAVVQEIEQRIAKSTLYR